MRPYSRLPRYFLLISCFLLVSFTAFAQTFRGGISGIVTDSTGAAIPGAPVTALAVDTGVSHQTTTSSSGSYVFQELPTGNYTVSVDAPGFDKVRTTGVVVSPGQIFDVPFQLGVAKANQSIDVSASALSLDVDSATTTATLTPQTVQDMPLNGRDYTQMVALTPGYSGYAGGQGFDGSLNGSRRNQVNWQIDGVDNNDFWHNEPAVNEGGAAGIQGTQLPIDTIDSFSVQTLSLPEAGRNSAGTVNTTLRSGTNQYHGSLYSYIRNEFFGVKNPFTTTKQKMRNSIYGGSLGMPIIKNKLFFFGSFEYGGYVLGDTGLGTEPSQAYQTLALAYLTKYSKPVNSVTTAMLANFWLPSALNGPVKTGNYQSPYPTTGHSYNGSAKFDYTLDNKNSVSFHWFSGEGTQTTPGSDQMIYYYSVVPTRAQNYALVWNYQISSKLSNQVLLGADYFRQGYGDNDHNFNPVGLGFNTGEPNIPGAPNLVIGTFDPIGLTPPEYRNGTTGHVTDDFTWVLGPHELRFGGEYRRGYVYEQYQVKAIGTYNFTGKAGPWAGDTTISTDPNVLALADFLGGYMASSQVNRGDQAREVFVNALGFFAQDSYKITPSATLSYGIRWDYAGAPYNQDKDLSVFVPSKGIVFQGAGISQLYPPSKINFSPRVGFTYRPSMVKNMVIRAGGGLYFDTPNMNVFLSQSVSNGGALGLQGNPGGASPLFTLSGQTNVMVVPGALYAPLTGSPATVCQPTTPCGLYTVNQNFKSGVLANYSLNIQEELARGVIMQIAYVGNQGRKEIILRDINQAALNPAGSATTTAQKQMTRPFSCPTLNCPYDIYGAINSLDSIGDSNYNALQVTFKTQNWHNLSTEAYYVWAHGLDDGTNYRSALPQDSNNIRGDYASSLYDITNTFRASLNYNIPAVANTPHWLTGGFELHSLVSIYGGAPTSIQSVTDQTGTGEGAQRAIQLSANPYAGANRSIVNYAAFWINPGSFGPAPNGTFATSRRDQVREPGFNTVDFSVFKTGKVTEKVKIQFRAEMFNLFNHVNYAPFHASTGTSLGQITSTIGSYEGISGIGPGEPFNTQFSAKILF